jgi:hypothetical protein
LFESTEALRDCPRQPTTFCDSIRQSLEAPLPACYRPV